MNNGLGNLQVLALLGPVVVLLLTLDVAALWDLAQRERRVVGGNKIGWLLLILLVHPWGTLIYFWLGRVEAVSDQAPTPPRSADAPITLTPLHTRESSRATPPTIRIEGLGKEFGRMRALEGLDLVVEGPGVFGFLGPNGAGKSTTIRMLTGLSRPSRGHASIGGIQVDMESGATARLVGYLAEDPQFYSWMSGREFLRYSGQLFGLGGPTLERRIDELLALVGLTEAGGRRLGGYSHGMRQRLGIAHALVHDPPVVILDEPVSALDPLGRREVLALLARLGKERLIFMSTHILADVERVCDHVAVLAGGRLLTTARTEELRERYAQPIFEVEFERPAPAFVAALHGLPWVAHVEEHGALVRVIAADVGAARAALLPLVAAAGVPLLRYEQAVPTLEDVFVRLVRAPAGSLPPPADDGSSQLAPPANPIEVRR